MKEILCQKKILTVEASILPPNQTAYLCIWCDITWTSIGFGWNFVWKQKLLYTDLNHRKLLMMFELFIEWLLTLIRPSLKLSLTLKRASTDRLISRCKRFPKSLNIVEPPLKTILLYSGRRTSIGQFWMTLSTISLIGVVKSGFENSGWKNISGPVISAETMGIWIWFELEIF